MARIHARRRDMEQQSQPSAAQAAPARTWTPVRDADLRKLRGLGYSYSRIALILGDGITRSACLGRAQRIGIQGPVRVHKPQPKKQKRRTASHVSLAPVPYEEPAARPDFLGITFDQLDTPHCRYPRGDGRDMLFCGQPKMDGSSYCPACHAATHRMVPVSTARAEAERDIAQRLAEAQAKAA